MLVLAVGTIGCGSGNGEKPFQSAADAGAAAPNAAAPSGDAVKVVNQDSGGSGKYQFVPSAFKFKSGQTINFSMTGETEFHTFTVDELKIDEAVVGDKTTTFTVTFDRPGTYKLYCIPHGGLGMVGTITVE